MDHSLIFINLCLFLKICIITKGHRGCFYSWEIRHVKSTMLSFPSLYFLNSEYLLKLKIDKGRKLLFLPFEASSYVVSSDIFMIYLLMK